MTSAGRVTKKWLLAQGAAIHDEWEKRWRATHPQPATRPVAVPPYDKPNGYLKREVYRLVRRCIAGGALETLKRIVAHDDSSSRPSAHNQVDPFYWGFMMVCGMDDRIRRQDRWKFANELLYAHRHDVPPELLVGFIYQIGSSDGLREKIRQGTTEVWHRQERHKV